MKKSKEKRNPMTREQYIIPQHIFDSEQEKLKNYGIFYQWDGKPNKPNYVPAFIRKFGKNYGKWQDLSIAMNIDDLRRFALPNGHLRFVLKKRRTTSKTGQTHYFIDVTNFVKEKFKAENHPHNLDIPLVTHNISELPTPEITIDIIEEG